MQSGSHPDTTVEFSHSLTCWAILDGVRREIESLDLERETNDLPVDTTGGTGVVAATAEIVWAQVSDSEVAEESATPWRRINGWPPLTEQGIQIWAQYDGYAPFLLFTGTIEDAVTNVYEGHITSTAVDHSKRFDNYLSRDPLIRRMVSREDQVNGLPLSTQNPEALPRWIHLSRGTVVDWALRSAGFGGIPIVAPWTVLSIPMVGTVWPEKGELWRAVESPTPINGPERTQMMALSAPILWRGEGQRVTNAKIHFYVELAAAQQALTAWGLGMDMEFGYNPAGSLHCAPAGGQTVYVAKQAGVNHFTITCAAGPGGVTYTLTHGTQTVTTSAPEKTNGDLTQLWVRLGTYKTSGGIYVEQGTTAPPAIAPTRKSIAAFPDLRLLATPTLVDVSARDILRDWSEATMAHLYVDEFGTARAAVYQPATPIRIVPTQLEELVSGTSHASVRAAVEVAWKEPTILGAASQQTRLDLPDGTAAYGGLPSAPLWRGQQLSLRHGESDTTFVHPPSEEDWIFPYTNHVMIGFGAWPVGKGRVVDAMWRLGPSLAGGSMVEEGSGATEYAGGYMTASFTRIDARTWRVYHYYTPPDARVGTTTFPKFETQTATSPPAHLQGTTATHLNGWAKVTWLDKKVTGAHLGPRTARVKRHETGWWAQTEADAAALADKLSLYTHKPAPSLPGVSVVPDLRLQLLDTVQIVDVKNGIDVTGFVYRIKLSVQPGSAQMQLGIRPTSQKVSVTLSDYDAAYATLPLDSRDTINASRTLAQFDADPLNKNP